MSVATLISEPEYLGTTYRPDCDYIEGRLEERHLGEFDHGDLQGEIVAYLRQRGRQWNIRAIPELRMRVSVQRYRIPDIVIVSREQPREPVLTSPPLACVEILSKDDTLSGMQDRIDDYLGFGVQNIWVLDPVRRRAWTCGANGITATETLSIAGTPVTLNLADLFAELD